MQTEHRKIKNEEEVNLRKRKSMRKKVTKRNYH